MKSETTKRSDTDATVKVTLDKTALAPFVKQTLDQLRGGVKAAGFRPGKAPDHIIERELGAGTVQNEVLQNAVQHSYAHAVSDQSLPVIAPPQVSITKFVPYDELEYTATVAVMPPVKLADYKNLKVDRPKIEVADEEVDRVVEDLRRRQAARRTVDRPAKIGDEINFDFSGTKDGQSVAGASSKSYDLMLGSGSFIPGFEDQLVGLSPGGAKDFDITFPKDYQASDLAGQTVKFSVTINTVSQVDLPPTDDKFAAEVSGQTTIAGLRTDIADRIRAEKTDTAERAFEQTVLEKILDASKFTAPAPLVDQQLANIEAEFKQRLEASGLDLEKYAKMSGKTVEQVQAEMRPEAEKRVGLALILTEIAKLEGQTVTPAEIDTELARLKSTYGDRDMQAELNRPEMRDEIYNHLLATRTIAKILSYIQ